MNYFLKLDSQTVTVNVNGLILSLFVPSNVAGRTKKSFVSSILYVAYCTGNAAGSQFFRGKDAPRYIPAIIACAICLGLECTFSFFFFPVFCMILMLLFFIFWFLQSCPSSHGDFGSSTSMD
jgi:hypothetical protein